MPVCTRNCESVNPFTPSHRVLRNCKMTKLAGLSHVKIHLPTWHRTWMLAVKKNNWCSRWQLWRCSYWLSSRERLSAHGSYIWRFCYPGAFDNNISQLRASLIPETNPGTDLLSSGFIFMFPLFRHGHGSLWVAVPPLWGWQLHRTDSLFNKLDLW